jgi:hypothetical protein
MDNIIVFVDRQLAIAIAAKLVGVVRTQSDTNGIDSGINWLISATYKSEGTVAHESDIRELLPEDLIYLFYPRIQERYDSLEEIIGRLSTGADNSYLPGMVVSIKGRLKFPGIDGATIKASSPFSDVEINLPVKTFHGERCVVAKFVSGDYVIPVYFSETSKDQVVFCNNHPVEVTGILRWVPPYSPGGGRSLNLALRCVVLWLR